MAELLPETHRLRNRYFEMWQQSASETLAMYPDGTARLGKLGVQLAEENNAAFLPNFNHDRASIPKAQQDTDNIAIIPFMRDADERLFLMASFKRRLNTKQPSPLQRLEGAVMSTASIAYELSGACLGSKKVGGKIGRELNAETIAGAHCTYLSFTRPRQISRVSVLFVASDIDRLTHTSPGLVGAVANHEYVHTIDAKTRDIGRYFGYMTEARAYHVERYLTPPVNDSSPKLLKEHWELSEEVEAARKAFGIPAQSLIDGTFSFTSAHNGYAILGGKPVTIGTSAKIQSLLHRAKTLRSY